MSPVKYQVRDHVAEIMLDNAPVNALDDEVVEALLAALRRARDDTEARAVILGSAIAGRFCAGLQLDLFRNETPENIHDLVEKLYVKLYDAQVDLGKPSIAAVVGAVRGGGMTVAISCDVIIAADNASFGYPEVDVGLIPGLHFTHLHRIVGRHRAFELLFSGRTFDAAEAERLGLVSQIVAEAEVLDAARKLARNFASKSPALMSRGRAAFYRGFDRDYREGLMQAVEDVCDAASTRDSKEGMAAFMEKRKPRWTGE